MSIQGSSLPAGAFTNLAGQTANTVIGQYLREVAERSRYKRYVLRQFGSLALQPGYRGTTIYAPTITNGVQNATKVDLGGVESGYGSASEAERTMPTVRKLAFSKYYGELNYYMDVYGVSKVFAATATLRKYLERAAEFLMVGCAQTEEELEIWLCLLYSDYASGGTTLLDPSSSEVMYQDPSNTGTAYGSLDGDNTWIPSTLAAIRRQLRNKQNPGFDNLSNRFAVVVTPDVSYQLMTNLRSDGTNFQLSFESDSMGMEEAYENHSIGHVLGCEVIECDHLPSIAGGASGGPSASATMDMCFAFAPDAFYVQEHETLNPQLYWSGFQVNTFTPAGEEATLAMDFSAGAFAGDVANKLVWIPSPQL